MVNAQPPSNDTYPYARFSPAMAVIIIVLVAALFFMAFFSIYVRHCSDTSTTAIGQALSIRGRRPVTTPGLDPSVIETFPTFSYSEVVDHKIGKGTLECAVCLNEFEDHDTLRLLPKCDHVFHPDCIDAWLDCHVTCPVCRANLVPDTDHQAAQIPPPPPHTNNDDENDDMEIRNDEIAIQIVDNNDPSVRTKSIRRTWSIRPPRMFGFAKFRSHSTGHSLVQLGENLDRFTLRLPADIRKDVMNRALLNRTSTLPVERSSTIGYRRIDPSDRHVKSDRWLLLFRKSQTGEDSGLKRSGSIKLPSFRCLEPKADGGDQTGLVSGRSPV